MNGFRSDSSSSVHVFVQSFNIKFAEHFTELEKLLETA